ncbi:MAG: glycosyltransferase [Ruminococcaceae bacterium]|nr:glycosyltransferase [Oscillospiraceae bacterium]
MFLEALLNIFQIFLFLIGCYYLVVALFSLTVAKGVLKSRAEHRFALLVAAHNEESVIGELVESLKGLDYPADKFDIFVVADNCTDKTAQVAANAGATVWERFNTEKRGKGYAMEFAFEKLFAMENTQEYFCVFDADNLVEKDFLAQMNSKINEGYSAVQGYLDSKNPTDNWLTFSYSLWYWINNRVAQLSRGNLGLGCRLGGTGFAVSSELIREYGWGATCLAEDTEFTLKLALSDIKVGWAHNAVVFDEKPRQLGTSIHQRQRWMQGLSEVATRFVKPLFEKGIKERSASALHMLMNFWSDTLYPLSAIFFWAVYALTIFADKKSLIYALLCGMWSGPTALLLLSVFVWGNLFVLIAGLYNDRKLDRNIMKNSLGFAIYIISWIPIGIMGFLKRDQKEWFHTPHSGKDGK